MAKRLFAAIAFWLFFGLSAHAITPPTKVPVWGDLSPSERQTLAPIGAEFDKLPDTARQRFRNAAKRYPKLTPVEQKRFQDQLTEWASLKPEERKKAREKYKEFQELPPEKRNEVKEKWRQEKENKSAQPTASPPPSPTTPAPRQ